MKDHRAQKKQELFLSSFKPRSQQVSEQGLLSEAVPAYSRFNKKLLKY